MADSKLKRAQIQDMPTDTLLGRDTPSSGSAEIITVGGGIEFDGTLNLRTSAFTGDATKTAGGTALTLATVNSNVGSFGSATQTATFTVNGKGLLTAAGNTTISIPSTAVSDFTEAVQDVVGNASFLPDTNTVDWTYNDAGNTLSAAVKTQLTITSDASGIRLVNDSATPGNSKYYGTDGSGTKGFFDLPSGGGSSSGVSGSVQFSGGSGTFSSDATNFFWDDTSNQLQLNGGTSYGINITGQNGGVQVAPASAVTGAVNGFRVAAAATGAINISAVNTNNSSSTAAARLTATTASGGGDPYVLWATGDQTYIAGIDNSLASDSFVLGQGTDPSTPTGTFAITIDASKMGIYQSTPTAKLHIGAGTATANTAPIKLTSGTALTTPEDGAIEYHGSHLYFTIGSTRYQLDQQSGGSTSWANLTSGTQTGTLTATLASTETFFLNYNGGNIGFYVDDGTSSSKMFSKDQTQFVEVNDTEVRIASGTTRMQYIDGVLRLYDSDQSNFIGITTPATGSLTANYTLTLPTTDGLNGQVLLTDGSGVLSWGGLTDLGGISGPVTSAANGVVLFDSTDGSVVKQATGTGIAVVSAGLWQTPLTAPAGTIVGTTDTQTLTNKRIDPRVNTTASSATVTVDSNTTDLYTITAQAAGLTLANPTGTPVQGQRLMYRIKDNGVARTIGYGANFRAMGVVLPTTTIANKTIYLGCVYNSTDTRWDVIAVAAEV
jgi:hypothetical protein